MSPVQLKARLKHISLIIVLLSVTLFGCTKDVQRETVVQGKAKWVTSSDAPLGKEESYEPGEVRVDFQKAASDLGLIVSAPKSPEAIKVEQRIQSLHFSRKPYDPTLAKVWIQTIANEDEKISKSFAYGAGMKIDFINESKTLVDIFEAIALKKGTARLVLVIKNKGTKNEETKYVDVPVGGDLIPVLDRYIMTNAGRPCDKVVCALLSVFGTEAAVYDVLFTHLRFKYAIGLMVPRTFLRYTLEQVALYGKRYPWIATQYADMAGAELKYQNRRRQYRVPTPQLVRRIAKSLWALPESFYGLSSFYSFLAAETKPTDRDPIFDGYAGFFHKSIPELKNGFIELNIESQNPYEYKSEWPAVKERVKPYVEEFNERMGIRTIVHELGHAYDAAAEYKAPGGSFDKDLLNDLGQRIVHRYGLSFSTEWLSLSGWHFIDVPEAERKTHPLAQLTQPPGREVTYMFWNDGPWVIRHDEETKVPAARYNFEPTLDFNFVRSYAKTNPVEDFAEHLAFAVMDPDVIKEIAPTKYRFLDSTILRGRSFERASYNSFVSTKP